jgi:hypothetical protein
MMHAVRLFLLSTLAALAPQGLGAAEPELATRPEEPYQRLPALERLMDWVTFGLSFDGETLTPDMAWGESRGKLSPTAEFAAGLVGRAARIGGHKDGAWGIFDRAGNFPIARRGALSLWLCPLGWDHRNDGYTPILRTTRNSFILERQGPLEMPDGKTKRNEALLALLITRETGSTSVAAPCGNWANGQWHLVVVNWSWPRLELSVDGGPLVAKAAKAPPQETSFGDLYVGSPSGSPTLIDELFIYRRPLAEGEIRGIWEAFRPGTKNNQ